MYELINYPVYLRMSIFYQFRKTLNTCLSLYLDYGDFFPCLEGGGDKGWGRD